MIVVPEELCGLFFTDRKTPSCIGEENNALRSINPRDLDV